MKNKIFSILLSLVLISCSQTTRDAKAKDNIFSVENRDAGVTLIWLVHDDIAIYCTENPEIAKKMNDYFAAKNNEVIVTYHSYEQLDIEFNGCLNAKGKDAKKVYVVDAIELTNGN